MDMMFGQYQRIESKTGGCFCSHRAFIKAAHTLLADKGKTREARTVRHQWIRSGLTMLDNSRQQHLDLVAGVPFRHRSIRGES